MRSPPPPPRRPPRAPPRPAPPRPAAPDRRRFLPVNRADLAARGWDEIDVLLISGDAYADHPSFGVPLLGRVLEAAGYRVGIVAQPRWDSPDDIARLGRPRLFCGISAGCLDSMLAHYTAFRKKRSEDAYTPGGQAGRRPNRACIVYSNLVRQAFPGLPIILGGIEASLRRAAHYDFWSDALRRSLLFDAKADLILYGMAETGIVEAARRLERGEALAGLPGSAWIGTPPAGAVELPSYEAMQARPQALMKATLAIEQQVHHGAPVLFQAHGQRALVLTPPAEPTAAEFEGLGDLPFTRDAHPDCDNPIPGLEMVRWSVTAVRGCGGGCSFCSLALHQGRRLRSRSVDSVCREVRAMTAHPEWGGAVSDIGGPTANLWGGSCRSDPRRCQRPSCLSPSVCPHLHLRQGDFVEMLRQARRLPRVSHVRVASGVRHDAALQDLAAARALTTEFVGGQLKLAPEHCVEAVLRLMRKSDFGLFQRFVELFGQASERGGRDQYVIPYVMSAFPGCTQADMKALAAWFRDQGWQPQQVQCFVPTPGTVATAMFYAGCGPSGRPLYVARTDREREDQHRILVPSRASAGGRRPGAAGASPTPSNPTTPPPRRGTAPRRGPNDEDRPDRPGRPDEARPHQRGARSQRQPKGPQR